VSGWLAWPLPVARGVQVAGIVVCVLNGQDVTHCQCFADLPLTASNAQVRKILLAAMGDWRRSMCG
jgi:hypothetical protein